VPRHLFPVAGLFVTQAAVLVEEPTSRSGAFDDGRVFSRSRTITLAEPPYSRPLVAMFDDEFRGTPFASVQPVPGTGSGGGLARLLVKWLRAHELE
jgi:hypothetical protein